MVRFVLFWGGRVFVVFFCCFVWAFVGLNLTPKTQQGSANARQTCLKRFFEIYEPRCGDPRKMILHEFDAFSCEMVALSRIYSAQSAGFGEKSCCVLFRSLKQFTATLFQVSTSVHTTVHTKTLHKRANNDRFE